MVAVSTERGVPTVLGRERVHLVETFTYEFRQPYHTAEKMTLDKARAFISRMQKEARQFAYRAIHSLQRDLQEKGFKLARCGLVLASGKPLPILDKILASHALIHTADGELFRGAILHASAGCALREFTIKERELLDRAAEVLRRKPSELLRRVTELGRPLGSPWTQDEKFATLTAWLALASKSAAAPRAR
jgi:hypothetical protein